MNDLESIENDLVYDGSDDDEAEFNTATPVIGDDALWGVKGEITLKEAQDAIRELLTYVRDGRLKAGLPAMKVVSPTTQGAQLVRVDTPATVAQVKTSNAKSDFENAVDDLISDDLLGDDALWGEDDEEELEEIPLQFARPVHEHNIHAWRKGDDVNVAMRVLKADGSSRVITTSTSHEAEIAKLVECFRQLGYTPDKILRLPLSELASRLGASALIAPTAKNAGAILGAESSAPYCVGLMHC